MRYSDEIKQELLARNNIVDIIGESVSLKRSGSNYIGLCPFHNEKTPSFSVSEKKQMYYCFGCHAGGNSITFLMEYHRLSYVESLRYLAERAGIALPEEELTPEERAASERRQNLFSINKKAAAFYYYLLKGRNGEPSPGLGYLTRRGLTDETVRCFALGYAGRFGSSLYRYLKREGFSDELLNESGLFYFDEKKGVSDRFWNRVIFPIQDERGRVIGFGGRVMGDGKPKYLNSPENSLFNKRRNLYALNYAKSTKRSFLILCEGYMDVITMHQAGFTNACASLGTALTEEQASLLRRYTGEVLLLYDSDEAGRNAALRAIPILRDAGLSVRVADLAPAKDPDELIRSEGAEEMEKRLAGAQNYLLFELSCAASSVNRQDPDAWTQFQRVCAEKLAAFSDELERMNYLEAICADFSIPREGMEKLVRSIAREGGSAKVYTPLKSGRASGEKKDARKETESAVLSWLASENGAYGCIQELICPEDFRDPLCRKIAGELFPLLEEGNVREALLLSRFPDSTEQTEAARILQRPFSYSNHEEKERAFTDAVARMIAIGAREELLESADEDTRRLMQFIGRKKLLEEFRRGRVLHLPR